MGKPYTFQLRDDDGLCLSAIDLDVSFAIEIEAGAATLRVTSLEMDRLKRDPEVGWLNVGTVDLLDTDEPLLKLLGTYAKSQIEDDQEWCAEQALDEGFSYSGLGGNDPDGRMRRVA